MGRGSPAPVRQDLAMNDHDDDEQIESLPVPAPADRFGDALALCRIANNKTIATALKKLRRVNRQIADAEAKVITVADQAEQMEAALDAREAAVAEGERALDARATKFESELQSAHAELCNHHRHVEEEDKRLRYRVMIHA